MAEQSGEIDPSICALCEQVPPALDDLFCVACRADLDARADEVVDPVEMVLAAHRRLELLSGLDNQECGCGWRMEGGPALHRRHVAAYVYEVLGLSGPRPWLIGSASVMASSMEAAGRTADSGSSAPPPE